MAKYKKLHGRIRRELLREPLNHRLDLERVRARHLQLHNLPPQGRQGAADIFLEAPDHHAARKQQMQFVRAPPAIVPGEGMRAILREDSSPARTGGVACVAVGTPKFVLCAPEYARPQDIDLLVHVEGLRHAWGASEHDDSSRARRDALNDRVLL